MSRVRELVRDVRMILHSAASPSSKFITCFQLLDAFDQPGCPVCTRLEEGAVKALDSLMYEQVNDPITRDRLVESHGFCNWHAWILPSVHNSALGVALIYRHLLQETLEHLEGEGWLIRLVRAWRLSGREVPGGTADNAHPRTMGELERLQLENAKLQRRLVEVSREWAEESARRAALQFQVYKLTEDVKVLELNLAGARGESKSGELHAERLREEIQALRDEIRRLRGGEGGASDLSGEEG